MSSLETFYKDQVVWAQDLTVFYVMSSHIQYYFIHILLYTGTKVMNLKITVWEKQKLGTNQWHKDG